MKHQIKNCILPPDVLIKQFMKTYKISTDEYHVDMETFENDIDDWLKILGKRVFYEIDIYPHLYILSKIRRIDPCALNNFALFFVVLLQRNCVVDTLLEPNISNILNECKKLSDMYIFVYLIATIQYYFL